MASIRNIIIALITFAVALLPASGNAIVLPLLALKICRVVHRVTLKLAILTAISKRPSAR